ncbi:MAG: hypothetical protein ACRDZ5_02180 [Acidimicrobiales bacterium]
MNKATPTAVVSDAWQYPGRTFEAWIPDLIERDRVIMAARPGMMRKLLPVRIDDSGVFSGGCYLFDSYENAQAFETWVREDFVLDGVNFFDRGAFLDPEGHLWHIVGMEDLADVHTSQDAMRFQRWHLPRTPSIEQLQQSWPTVRKDASSSGLSSIWLLYCPDAHHPQLGLVMSSGLRSDKSAGDTLPLLDGLESLPSPATELAGELDGTKVFDRTSWIYTVWFPVTGGGDKAPLFPSSPPLPFPTRRL